MHVCRHGHNLPRLRARRWHKPLSLSGQTFARLVVCCYGGSEAHHKHLASGVHFVDDEIIEWLKRREQRRQHRKRREQITLPGGRLACSWQSVYKHLP